MTLREYIKNLTTFAEENPESLDFQVVSSSDGEGNSYEGIYYTPSLGYYEDREFHGEDYYEEYEAEYEAEDIPKMNSVCIN